MKTRRIYSILIVPLFGGLLWAWSPQQGKQNTVQQEEREDYFKGWLEKDVVYIITQEEEDVFKKLTTDDEKEQFIEQFWRRRDTDRRTGFNEFKEEHYRRTAYANDHFMSGVEGWYTDRGRMHIKFGPPTSIERNPTGGVYDRPITEGGGTTMTYPREVWYYQYIEGVGSGVEIEFVDSTSTGRYEMALRPEEKDALLYTTGAGNTLFESLGLETRGLRIRRSDAMRPLGLGDDLTDPGASPFKRLERLYDLERPPANKFDDLRSSVDARVRYDNLPFQFREDWFRVSAQKALVNLTLRLDPDELTFAPIPGSDARRASVNLYARVQTLSRRIVFEFDDVLYSDATMGARSSADGIEEFLYQYYIPLEVGRYKLTIILEDEQSGKLGSSEGLIVVPESDEEKLTTSSILLADHIGPAMTDDFPVPFVTAGGLKIYPNMGNVFGSNAPMGLYAEIYNPQVDQSTQRPALDVSCQFLNSSGEVVQEENLTAIATVFYGDRVSVARYWPSSTLPPGKYIFRLNVEDRVGNQKMNQDTELTIAAVSGALSPAPTAAGAAARTGQ